MHDSLPSGSGVLDPALTAKLNRITALPSPPGVASQLVEMSQDPAIGMADVAAVVELDPAVTAKILKTANSPAFARQRTVSDLTQAVTLLGLSETLSMALSFSLVNSLRSARDTGLNYPMFWRRSLGVATFARVLARLSKAGDLDRYFLCGLLQDIGMLVIDVGFPDVYEDTAPTQVDHEWMRKRERRAFGNDHAAIGAWLLREWAFPEHFFFATLCSHEPAKTAPPEEFSSLINHTYIAQLSGDLWWRRDWGDCARRGARACEELLGIGEDTYIEALNVQAELLRETASVFDIDLGDTGGMDTIIAHAADALETDTLFGAQELVTEKTEPGKRKQTAEDRRDELTGLYNREYLEKLHGVAFGAATKSQTPLCLLALEIDAYENMSDKLGAAANDLVRLLGAALQKAIRKTDVVGRYADSRFLVYLPGTPLAGADVFAKRVLEVMRQLGSAPSLVSLSVSISIGVAATTTAGVTDGKSLVAAATTALDGATDRGGDQIVLLEHFDPGSGDDGDDDNLAFEIPGTDESEVIPLA